MSQSSQYAMSQSSQYTMSQSSQDEKSPSLAPPPVLEVTQLTENQQKRTHLVTWSQAVDSKLPNKNEPRSSFASLVVGFFAEQSCNALHWSCCRELHECGGHHYHLAIEFSKKTRWLQVANKLRERDINVNFQSFQSTYKDAFQYVTKEDPHFTKSQSHPRMLPKIPKTMQPFKRKSLESSFESSQSSPYAESTAPPPPKQLKAERLTNTQIRNIIIQNDIKTDTQLCAFANDLCDNNQSQLGDWMMNHPNEKNRLDIIKTAWKMNSAADIVQRANTPRLQKLRTFLDEPHAVDEETGNECGGRWLHAACQILQANNKSVREWQETMKACLQMGRAKQNNIFLIGERNCGKTFLLQPLTKIFTTFCNPATGTFNWVGAINTELVYLNDFRYPPVEKGREKVIPWSDFLNLTDGSAVTVAAPKTHFAQDLQWTAKQPIVATGSQHIKFVRAGLEDRTETSMMECRWKYIHLTKSIPDHLIDNTLLACPRCFAHLILNGMDLAI